MTLKKPRPHLLPLISRTTLMRQGPKVKSMQTQVTDQTSVQWIKQSTGAARAPRTQSRGIAPPRNTCVERPCIWILTALKAARGEEEMPSWGAALQLPPREQETDGKLPRSRLLQTPPTARAVVIPVQAQGARTA